MIIKVDAEGARVIEQLADLALKQGGLSNLKAVNDLFGKVELIEDKQESEI